MPFFMTLVVFVGLAVAVALVGMKLYVRPREAMERVVGGIDPADQVASHPSLAFHDLIKKLGNIVPQSPKDVTVMQRRLIRAGIRNESALKILYGAKAALGVLLPLLTAAVVSGSSSDSGNKFAAILAAAAVGFFGPNEYVRRLAGKRQKEIARGLANALDLMVVCVESGLGLDQAILQVAKELEHAHPEISQEFGLVNLELKAGKRRVEALRNLAERTGVDDLKKLVAVLIQADRFGTGVAQSLRAHADFMRIQARQVAEEKAAKLGVKLIFPIFFCILPSLFVITVGPVIMKIIRELVPMMNSI
ncbi:MAG TPA: type II secretion system F family protein [Bryobacteraceae bacterium]|jgi:tight adherence protein C|nr:type II secretion system F family protein [Bryobacteraceae bacterium]